MKNRRRAKGELKNCKVRSAGPLRAAFSSLAYLQKLNPHRKTIPVWRLNTRSVRSPAESLARFGPPASGRGTPSPGSDRGRSASASARSEAVPPWPVPCWPWRRLCLRSWPVPEGSGGGAGAYAFSMQWSVAEDA
jgi:hypothetical protein